MLIGTVNKTFAPLKTIEATEIPQPSEQAEKALVAREEPISEKALPNVFSLQAKAKVDGTYKKSSKAVQFAKSNRVPYGIWFNPVKWQITNNFNNAAEHSFGLIGKDTYAFMINEGIKMPMENLTDHVINNLNAVSEKYSIIEVEDRKVNGLLVKYIRADARINGVDINYMIYLHCGEKGTVQIYGYTYGKNFKELEEFMNGFSKRT